MRGDRRDEAGGDEATRDEDATQQDLRSVPAAEGPPTVEERIASFAPVMPPPVEVKQEIRSRTPTARGLAPPRLGPDGPTDPDGVPAAFAAPRIVGGPDGPTDPEGVPAAFATPRIVGGPDGPTDPDGIAAGGLWEGATDPEGGWDAATDPEGPRPPPDVPAPDAPSIQISKSMEIEVAKLAIDPPADPKSPPVVKAAKRAGMAPTEQLLPALERRKPDDDEGSDWPLVLGLGALAVLILTLLAAVAVGVMEAMGVGPFAG
ncbi:MAG TPA: hypothetical protein RMH99_20585 [Sandaracinaceae bacterium LLY-WYZ-13_1]|nr:hypothetical protein [Sandaracinaceae bacterium LLY-WYZ-13_1]